MPMEMGKKKTYCHCLVVVFATVPGKPGVVRTVAGVASVVGIAAAVVAAVAVAVVGTVGAAEMAVVPSCVGEIRNLDAPLRMRSEWSSKWSQNTK